MKNPDRVREQHRRQLYRLEPEAYAALLFAQDNKCAICREASPNCVDHSHASRRVRGVLCRKCNAGLGQFRDDPARLEAAIRYLARAVEAEKLGAPASLVPQRRRHRRSAGM